MKPKYYRDGEGKMAQCLGADAAPCRGTIIHIGQLINSCHSSSRGPNALFWPPPPAPVPCTDTDTQIQLRTCTHTHTHTRTCTHTRTILWEIWDTLNDYWKGNILFHYRIFILGLIFLRFSNWWTLCGYVILIWKSVNKKKDLDNRQAQLK